ncbi:MAG: hypothetical protein WB392_15175 [Methanotrichaceae archaeon]
MGRIGVYLSDDLEAKLKEYALKTTGKSNKTSDVAAKAIEEYLARHAKD